MIDIVLKRAGKIVGKGEMLLTSIFSFRTILDSIEFKAFADNKITQCLRYDKMENIVGKGEKHVSNIFSFCHNVFKTLFPQSFFTAYQTTKI